MSDLISICSFIRWKVKPGNTNLRERVTTFDLLINVPCFATKVNNFVNIIYLSCK